MLYCDLFTWKKNTKAGQAPSVKSELHKFT